MFGTFLRRVAVALSVLAGLWLVVGIVLQAARCTGTDRMMMFGAGVVGIATCVISADHREIFRLRLPDLP